MIKICDCKTRLFKMDVEMLDCLFQIDDQQDQGEDAEEEEDTRHVHDVATATNPVASHGETGKTKHVDSLSIVTVHSLCSCSVKSTLSLL